MHTAKPFANIYIAFHKLQIPLSVLSDSPQVEIASALLRNRQKLRGIKFGFGASRRCFRISCQLDGRQETRESDYSDIPVDGNNM